MDYPHISLKIEDFVPSINFVSDQNTSNKITTNDENLLSIVSVLAKDLNLVEEVSSTSEDLYNQILGLARESVSEGLNEIPGLDPDTTEFEIQKTVDGVQKEIEKDELEGAIYEKAVRDELERNEHIDTLSTALESIYSVMILKTLLAASELGIGTIVLDDKTKNSRLMEKMALELERMDLELLIPENEAA